MYVKGIKLNDYSALGLNKVEQTAVNNHPYNSTEYRCQGANPNNYIIKTRYYMENVSES